MCDVDCVEDEIHELIDCRLYKSDRQTLFPDHAKKMFYFNLSVKEKIFRLC